MQLFYRNIYGVCEKNYDVKRFGVTKRINSMRLYFKQEEPTRQNCNLLMLRFYCLFFDSSKVIDSLQKNKNQHSPLSTMTALFTSKEKKKRPIHSTLLGRPPPLSFLPLFIFPLCFCVPFHLPSFVLSLSYLNTSAENNIYFLT